MTNDEFIREAQAIGARFIAGSAQGMGGSDLNALVEKVARDRNLNDEQIRRLTRATNSEVFSLKYAELRAATDRRVDFETANEDTVIARLIDAAAPPPVPEPASYPKLAHWRETRPRAFHKVAEEAVTPHLGKTVHAPTRYAHLRKLARELPTDLRQLDVRWQHTLRDLADTLDASPNAHFELEKNALAVLGEDLIPELNQLREHLKLAALTVTQEKLAEARDYVIGTPDRVTQALSEARSARHGYQHKLSTLQKVKEELPYVEAQVNRG